ncbi:MAG: hypothetical protein WKF57_04405 [Nakamurella sp.]
MTSNAIRSLDVQSSRMAPSVLIVTASVGAGHDRPAHEMARRVRQRGGRAVVVDLVELAPLGTVLRTAFRTILTRCPQLWGRLHESCDATGQLPPGIQAALNAAGRRLARIAEEHEVDLTISTFPLGGRVVGAARDHCNRRLPLATYLTDPAVHTLWLDQFTDVFLTTWDFVATSLVSRTDIPVALCAPAVGSAFGEARFRRVHPHASPGPGRALICSGSWGVGDVLPTVLDVLRYSRFQPVVACGRNENLRRCVTAIPGAVGLGWIEDMASLMRTCEVAVLNSGGLTLAEAATVGMPVVHARPLAGQGLMNAMSCQFGARIPNTSGGPDLGPALDAAQAMTGHLGRIDPFDMAWLTLVGPRAQMRTCQPMRGGSEPIALT